MCGVYRVCLVGFSLGCLWSFYRVYYRFLISFVYRVCCRVCRVSIGLARVLPGSQGSGSSPKPQNLPQNLQEQRRSFFAPYYQALPVEVRAPPQIGPKFPGSRVSGLGFRVWGLGFRV